MVSRNILAILGFGLFVLLLGCVLQQSPSSKPSSFGNASPITNTPSKPVVLPADTQISLGDNVTLDYVLWVNGTPFESSNAKLAKQYGIYDSFKSYKPLRFEVAFDKGLINGFVARVVGLIVNESENFTVPPQQAYGFYSKSKLISVPRYVDVDTYEQVPRGYLEKNKINISKGSGFKSNYGLVYIDDFNDTSVTLHYLFLLDQTLEINGVPTKVVNVSNLSATLEYNLAVGETYVLPDPQTGQLTNFKISNKSNDAILLDGNHPLAGQTLKFQVTILKIERNGASYPK